MKLSRRSDYALRAVHHCAKLPSGTLHSINTIAESAAVPREFLAKILKDLTDGGILTSYKGIKGGYALARKPRSISFLDVIEAVDGPLYLSLCTEPPPSKRRRHAQCELCKFWTTQEKSIKQTLQKQHFGKYSQGRK